MMARGAYSSPGNARPAPMGGRFTPTPVRALPLVWGKRT